MNLVEYPDRDMMMIDIANQVADALAAAVHDRGVASMAVPGGSTPAPMFDALCAADVAWSNVTIMATDERCVPEHSERSNARMIRERLLTGRAAAATFLSFSMDPQDDMAIPNAALAPFIPLDLLVLGMGDDMHTASLFPGAPELAAALDPKAPYLVPMTPQDGLEPRLTLSGPVLASAISTHVLITGANKRKALETAASTRDTMLAPIRMVLQQATIHWAE